MLLTIRSRLYVVNKKITSISSLRFTDPASSQLRDLHLYDNPLSTISHGAFKHLTQSTDIRLENIRLTRHALNLAHLSDLGDLDLRNIPDMTCTCAESSLVTWYDA